VLGKDVENQGSAVDNVDLEELGEVALLGRCQLVVEDHDVDVFGGYELCQLGRFAATYVISGVWRFTSYQLCIDRIRPRRIRQQGELVQGTVGVWLAHPREHHAYQKCSLAGYLEVSDRRSEPPALSSLMVVSHAVKLPLSVRKSPGFISQVLAFITDVVELFFGNDLGFAHSYDRFPCRWPDEPPCSTGYGPEPLSGLHIDQSQGVVAVFGSDGYE